MIRCQGYKVDTKLQMACNLRRKKWPSDTDTPIYGYIFDMSKDRAALLYLPYYGRQGSPGV
jgi:hypothetical protein